MIKESEEAATADVISTERERRIKYIKLSKQKKCSLHLHQQLVSIFMAFLDSSQQQGNWFFQNGHINIVPNI